MQIMFAIHVSCHFFLLLLHFESTQSLQFVGLQFQTTPSRQLFSSMSLSSSSSSFSSEEVPISINNELSSPSTANGFQGLTPHSSFLRRRRRRQMHKDVVIVGGGLSGLSTALYLAQIDPHRHITILERNTINSQSPSTMASLAAAGMLAPHSERLPKGEYLDLCMASRKMFADFVAMVESLAQEAGPEGAEFLPKQQQQPSHESQYAAADAGTFLEPWNVGYVASGGFLAPAFAGDNVATWAPPEYDENDRPAAAAAAAAKCSAMWLDATQVRELEPHLHPEVVGGWWFPEDASVDAQRLTCSLKAACVGLGVEFLCGPQYEVTSLDLEDGKCCGVWLKSGKYVSTTSLVVANGAWMRNLLPVPLEPHKGQSLSLRMPKDRPPLLRRVLFAQDSYIVPKADGRIVIGATVEAGRFDANVTPAGIMHILSHAMQLVPGLADLPLEDTWAGLRPTTPDKGPILGETPWKNLFLAGGNWRNGVLLAPKTGQLVASLIASRPKDGIDTNLSSSLLTQKDEKFLRAFAWDRFISAEGAKQLAANTRYAASMYPVHTRQSGAGVAAAVGTELGSYSTARLAKEERRKDRQALFGYAGSANGADNNAHSARDTDRIGSADDTNEAFERAAKLGIQDALAFEGLENTREEHNVLQRRVNGISEASPSERNVPTNLPSLEASISKSHKTIPFDGDVDAFTVGTATADDGDKEEASQSSSSLTKDQEERDCNLQSIYQSIANNKSKQKVELPEKSANKRPDPGFRIYHLDTQTGEETEVPPYTSPGQFLETLKQKKRNGNPDSSTVAYDRPSSNLGVNEVATPSEYSETTYDGYQAILDANGSTNREDELKAMREARRRNRLEQADVEY